MATSQTTVSTSKSNNGNTSITRFRDVGFTGRDALGLVSILEASEERVAAQHAFAFQQIVDAGQANLRLIADRVSPSKFSDVIPFVVIGGVVVGGVAVLAKLRR